MKSSLRDLAAVRLDASKPADRIRAVELLGRLLGMFDLEAKIQASVDALTDEQRAERVVVLRTH